MSDHSRAVGHGDQPLVKAPTVGEWRAAVRDAVADGWSFGALWAQRRSVGIEVRAAFTRGNTSLLLRCPSPSGRFRSIVDIVPAAQWDEREAHDLYGAQFNGHSPMRALVAHPDNLDWSVPVSGPDHFQVAVGPIHAGVIESGHFRFHVVGERILHLDLQLFYNHRGLELEAEGNTPDEALPYMQRACGADAVTNAVAFAHACECALGLWPTPALSRARTLLLELERLYNHLNDIAAICAGVGFTAANMLFAALKEQAQRLNQRITGHRFLFDQIHVGRSELQLGADECVVLRNDVEALQRDFERAWHELQFAGSAQERFTDVGVLSAVDAIHLGAVGPTARASGIAVDARAHSSRLAYRDFRAVVPVQGTGDAAARLEMRALELPFVFDTLQELLASALSAAHCTSDLWPPCPDGVGIVESPRGRTLCAVHLQNGMVARVHLRTGSYANWPVLAHVVPGNLLPDFPLINKSFELCYACTDR